MKPKSLDLFLVILILATVLLLIHLVISIIQGEEFWKDLVGIALFGYFLTNYWRSGKVTG